MSQVPSSDLQGKVQDVAGQAQESLHQVAGQATDTIKQQLDERSTTAGESVGSISEAARHSAQELRSQGQDLPAQVIEQAAGRVEQLGQYLRNASGDQILRDVESFGRQQPWAVIAGGVFVGFAASRFLKASSSRRYDQARSQSSGYSSGYDTYTPLAPPEPYAGSALGSGGYSGRTMDSDPYVGSDMGTDPYTGSPLGTDGI